MPRWLQYVLAAVMAFSAGAAPVTADPKADPTTMYLSGGAAAAAAIVALRKQTPK